MNKKKKTSKAQLKAIYNWRKNNPEANRINNYKQSAKTFVRHHATKEDMEELLGIYKKENPNSKK